MYKHHQLVDNIEFENRVFIPIVQICADSLLTSYEKIFATVSDIRYIHDSMERCCCIKFENHLLTNINYICYFKIYWNYDMEIRYKKPEDESETLVFMKQYHVKNMVNTFANLIDWGFLDFADLLIMRSKNKY